MRCFIFLTCLLTLTQISLAQQAVQQPAVGATSVNSTVSVPDRGGVFLGGVSSAESSRNQYGPLRTGPSNGISRQASSMSVHVYIHDLQAMDEALLNSAPSTAEAGRSKSQAPSTASGRENPVDPAAKAAKYEQFARKADEEGRFGVAKLHWQMAAKYGSNAAKVRLSEGPPSSSARPNQTAAR